VETLASTVSDAGWRRLSCSAGAKGEHRYDGSLMLLPRWLAVDGYFATVLTQRSLSVSDQTYFLILAPLGTRWETLVRVAGSR